MNQSNFALNLDESGKYLEIHTILPDIFTDIRRIENIHEVNKDLNKNRSRFTAFTKIVQKVEKKKRTEIMRIQPKLESRATYHSSVILTAYIGKFKQHQIRCWT